MDKKNIFLKFILIYLILFTFYNFILFYKEVKNINLLLSNIFFNIIFVFSVFLFSFKIINNIINKKNKKIFIYYIINGLWFILIFIFNKKSFEINNYYQLNIHNSYWIILYLIDIIYFGIILLTMWFFTIYLRIKFINLKIKKFILKQKNKLQRYLLFLFNFILKEKIKLNKNINISSINWIKFNKIILISNIKKTIRLIEFKRGHFPHLF